MALPGPRHLKRAALLLTATALTAALLPAGVAAAATHPVGHMDPSKQAANGIVSVQGWAFDRGRTGPSVQVDVYVDAHFVGRPTANRPRAGVNTKYHVTGNHGLSWTIAVKHRAHVVTVWARPLVHGEARTLIGTLYLNGYRPPAPAGTRIIAEARKFVGHDPYVFGGTSPTKGFDCSGYTQYVYRVTKVASLPRTAEQQRRAVHLIARAQARPGDLVFYLSGGSAFHIAIYAGNGRQYAAANERQGIIYERVWSSAVQYGTTWH
jgi:cell wall-associated NlpC family hydrolase